MRFALPIRRSALVVFAVAVLNPQPSVVNPQSLSARPELALQIGHNAAVNAVAFSPDGRIIASGSEDRTIKLWDVTRTADAAQAGFVLRTLRGHKEAVNSVAFSPDGKTLVSGSSDGTIALWRAPWGERSRTLLGHKGVVTSVAFAPDGKTIASGSHDKTVRLWDAETGEVKRQLTGHTGAVLSVAFSHDGKTIASAGADKTAILNDPDTGAEKRVIKVVKDTITSVALSPDGAMLVTGDGNVATLWDANTGEAKKVLTGHKGLVTSVAFSPDGKMVASGSRDNTAKVWDRETGLMLRSSRRHGGPVTSVAFSSEGNTIACASMDRTVAFWEAVTRCRTIDMGGVFDVAFSPDGNTLATAVRESAVIHGMVKLWDTRTWALTRTLTARSDMDHNYLYSVAFSPDGRTLASGGGDGVSVLKVWNARTGQLEWEKQWGDRATTPLIVMSVVFSPNGKTIATNGQDGTIRLWDAATGQLKHEHKSMDNTVAFSPNGKMLANGSGVFDVQTWEVRPSPGQGNLAAFSPDGSTLAFGRLGEKRAGQGGSIALCDARTGKLTHMLTGPDARFATSLAFSPDGETLASGSTNPANQDDSIIRLWDTKTGELLVQTLVGGGGGGGPAAFSPSGKILASAAGAHNEPTLKIWEMRTEPLLTLTGQGAWTTSVAFSPDGKTTASAAADHSVRLWDAQTAELRKTLTGHSGEVTAVAFYPSGAFVAGGGKDGMVKVWNAQSGLEEATLRVGSPVTSLAFTSDGKTMLTGSADGNVRLWELATRKARTISAHKGGVESVAFSPDGRTFASGGRDNFVRLWNTQTGAPEKSFVHEAPVLSVAFAPDGKLVASGSEDKTVRVWEVTAGTLKAKLTGHRDAVNSVTFSSDGKTIVSGSEDERVLMWDVAMAMVKRELLGHQEAVLAVAMAADGNTIVSGGSDHTLKFWDANTGKARVTLMSVASANDKIAGDWMAVTEEGYYDSSAGAARYIRFRIGDDLFPAESFQSRYYRPDLIRRALAGSELPLGGAGTSVPPLVFIISPKKGDHVASDTLTATLEATDDTGIVSVALFVNGARVDAKPITADARPITADAKPITADARSIPSVHKMAKKFIVTVPLPPNDTTIKLQAIAFDDDGLQSPLDEIILTCERGTAVAGNLLGLCVGVSQYKDAKLNLKYADADANALVAELNKQRGLYSTAQMTSLTNEQATRETVKAGLDKLVAQATRADTVIVSVSGHGWRDTPTPALPPGGGGSRVGGDFYFATHEVNRNEVANTALPWREVVERLTKLSEKSKRVIVLLDACHSGSAATNEELVKAVLMANAGVIVFASSKGSEVSLEMSDIQHGVFTKALLEAIGGQAAPNEKSLTLWDFVSYVRKRVKELTQGTQNPQVPFLQFFDIDAAIVAK